MTDKLLTDKFLMHLAIPKYRAPETTPKNGEVFTMCGLTWPPSRWPKHHGWTRDDSPVCQHRCSGCFPNSMPENAMSVCASGKCAFCPGDFQVAIDGEKSWSLLHTLPYCTEYVDMRPDLYVQACREKMERAVGRKDGQPS